VPLGSPDDLVLVRLQVLAADATSRTTADTVMQRANL
jgi:hypothetical protein